jgi:tetratricopeptide (TPR) repeat protein
MGFTPMEEESYARFMLYDMMDHPPFTLQTGHARLQAEKKAALERKYKGLRTAKAREKALSDCERAAERRPGDLYVQGALLNHYVGLNLRAEAIDLMRLMLEQVPGDYVLMTKLAGEYMRTGKGPEAEALFRKAIAINPYYYVAQHNLQVLLLRREGKAPPEPDPGVTTQPPP